MNKIKMSDYKERIIYIFLVLPILVGLYFAIPRPQYRASNGYIAGVILLLGVVCAITMVAILRKQFQAYDYLMEYAVIVYSVVVVLLMMYYKARICVVALGILGTVAYVYLVIENGHKNKGLKISIKESLIPTICMFSVILPYCILGPLEIYAGNQAELTFPYYHFFVPLTVIAIAITVIGGLLLILLEKKLRNITCTGIVSVALISWIQAMFLNTVIFDVNGHSIEWSQHSRLTKINLGVWILVVAIVHIIYIVLTEKKKVNYVNLWIATPLVMVQLVAVISLLIITNPNPNAQWIFEGSDELKIGKKANVIVFILDAFGQVSLDKAIGNDPDMIEPLHDFTMYTDVNSTYNGTFPSVTYMFSGVHVPDENGFDVDRWLDEVCASDEYNSFFEAIHSQGYKISYYNFDTELFGKYSNVEGRFDNVASIVSKVKYGRLLYTITKMSCYRYAPYIVKPLLETDTAEFFGGNIFYSDKWSWPLGRNCEIYDGLINEGLSFSENDNEIKVIHTLGLHQPYTTDRNCCEIEKGNIEDNIYGIKLMIDEYLGQLKALGKYNDATIVITADHGGGTAKEDISPILLIKRPAEKHSKLISTNIPVDSRDFRPSILESIGYDDYSDFGISVFENKGGVRTRIYNKKLDMNHYERYEFYSSVESIIDILN